MSQEASPPARPGIVAYKTWEKAVLDSPDLRAFNEPDRKARRYHVDIRFVALMIAKDGANGRNCFASSETVAAYLGCGRGAVERARKALIERGWFTVVSRRGGTTRRAMVVDIALPGNDKDKSQPVPHARTREAPEAVTYNGAVVFGASGADPWDEDEEDEDSGGPPVKMREGKRRAWG